MSLLSIQFGKVVSSVRNDGVVLALGRVWSGVWSMVRSIGSGEVLLISGGIGDSARYRTKHVAEFLRNHGIKAQYAAQRNLFVPGSAKKFRVFVFHRVFMDERMRKFVDAIKREKKTIIFETDDVTFDFETFRKTNGYAAMNSLEKRQYEGGLGTELLRDPYVQVATTTTNFLAQKLQAFGKEVFVVPNMLSEGDMQTQVTGDKDSSDKQTRVTGDKKEHPLSQDELHVTCHLSPVTIAYFSGTRSHDRDFASIAPAVVRVLKTYPNAILVIAGPLKLGNVFGEVSKRIVHLPFADRKRHFRNIASVDINLAPLEVGDAFCEAKSELKWIEAGAVGVPTVASATRTFREAIVDGEDGFVAEGEDEWVAKLSQLVENTDLRRKMGLAARKKIWREYTTKSDRAGGYVNRLRVIVVEDSKV